MVQWGIRRNCDSVEELEYTTINTKMYFPNMIYDSSFDFILNLL